MLINGAKNRGGECLDTGGYIVAALRKCLDTGGYTVAVLRGRPAAHTWRARSLHSAPDGGQNSAAGSGSTGEPRGTPLPDHAQDRARPGLLPLQTTECSAAPSLREPSSAGGDPSAHSHPGGPGQCPVTFLVVATREVLLAPGEESQRCWEHLTPWRTAAQQSDVPRLSTAPELGPLLRLTSLTLICKGSSSPLVTKLSEMHMCVCLYACIYTHTCTL